MTDKLNPLDEDAKSLFGETVENVLVIIETARCSPHANAIQKAYLGQATRSIVDAIDEAQSIIDAMKR